MSKKRRGRGKKKQEEERELIAEPDPLDLCTEAEKAYYKETFELFDDKHTGFIEPYKILPIMEQVTDQKLQVMKLQEIIDKHTIIDADTVVGVSFPKFIAILKMYLVESQTDAEVIEAFKVFDEEETGQISINQLRYYLTKIKSQPDQSEIEEFLKDAAGPNYGIADSKINFF